MRHRLPRELEEAPLIQHGGLARKLIEALHIHGKVAAPTLGDQVMPVVVIEDLTRESFVSGYGEQKDGGGYVDEAPAAGLFGCAVLTNPATSNMVILVESIQVALAGNGSVILYTPGGIRSQSGTTYFRDSRIPGVPSGLVTFENNLAVTDPGVIMSVLPGGTTIVASFAPDHILGPGASIGVRLDAAASSMKATFRWIERPIVKPNA